MRTLYLGLIMTASSLLVCGALYPVAVWAIGRIATPSQADGSLVHDATGRVVGSALIGQRFTAPRYFWGRPSAVDYDGAAAGGSNLAASNPALRARIEADLARLAIASEVPADLVTASGSGLDPDISLAGARAQIPRVAAARGIDAARLEALVNEHAFAPAPWDPTPLVRVLELNLALDALGAGGRG